MSHDQEALAYSSGKSSQLEVILTPLPGMSCLQGTESWECWLTTGGKKTAQRGSQVPKEKHHDHKTGGTGFCLCSPGCFGTHSAEQAGLELMKIRVLGVKACTITQLLCYFLNFQLLTHFENSPGGRGGKGRSFSFFELHIPVVSPPRLFGSSARSFSCLKLLPGTSSMLLYR